MDAPQRTTNVCEYNSSKSKKSYIKNHEEILARRQATYRAAHPPKEKFPSDERKARHAHQSMKSYYMKKSRQKPPKAVPAPLHTRLSPLPPSSDSDNADEPHSDDSDSSASNTDEQEEEPPATSSQISSPPPLESTGSQVMIHGDRRILQYRHMTRNGVVVHAPLSLWQGCADHAFRKFKIELDGLSDSEYVEEAYRRFYQVYKHRGLGSHFNMEDSEVNLERILGDMKPCLDAILDMRGVGSAYNNVHGMFQRVQRLLLCIQEMLWEILSRGAESLVDLYMCRKLMFQSY
ncbi:hypothetical protein ARMGADRAFT_1022607 [Armillaria gallica]|uniref:Uncharacterized protein n=1 Tax=Armillaria gallica TaxID=47427 RepID=A0A2H3ECZ1_ARMGA|nr:hypothetical protein ARMGADRAFT_1022607 [Armillaria gallica]